MKKGVSGVAHTKILVETSKGKRQLLIAQTTYW